MEEYDFIIKGKIEADSRYLATDFLESIFDGAPVKLVKVDVDNVSSFYPVGV